MTEIGIGIIGAGDVVTGKHLPALAGLPGARLRSIYDTSPERARTVAAKWGIEAVAPALDALVSDAGVHAVLVATPNFAHCEGADAAARADKHLLCEKPLAITLADSRAIIETCRQHQVLLQVGFHHRFQPQLVLARSLIASGVIGRVHSFQSTTSEPLTLIPSADNYRFDASRSGGLTLVDIGTHRLDFLAWLLGPMAAVSAVMANVDHRHELEDNAVLLLETAAGALGSLGTHRFSRAAMTGTILHAERGLLCFSTDVLNPYQSVPLAVYLEEPFANWPELLRSHHYGPVWWDEPDRGWVTISSPKVNCYRAEWEHFLAAIREPSQARHAATGEDSLHVLEIVLAAYESFRTGRRVSLPLPADFASAPPHFGRAPA